jgi:hypothetical protein
LNWYPVINFIISFIGIPFFLYLAYTGVLSYKRSRNKNMLYFISSFTLFALMMFLYSFTPFLAKGQDFFAEITLGGSFILSMLILPIYIEYFHGIYKNIQYISTIFYFAVGGGFVMLFFQPWEIQYANDLHGYSQTISDLLLICMFIQFACVFFTMIQAYRVIKTKVNDEFMNVDQILKESTDNPELLLLVENRKDNLHRKNRVLNYIIFSYFLGICVICIGLLFPLSYIDSLGILIIAVPQAYFFSRDKEILVYLSAQKLQEDTKGLQTKFSKLHQQSNEFPHVIGVEVQSLIDFIEKADLILPHRKK